MKKTHKVLSAAFLSLAALAGVQAQPLPPPATGGLIKLEMYPEEGLAWASEHSYEPASANAIYTLRAEILGATSFRTASSFTTTTARIEVPGIAGQTLTKFEHDPTYLQNHPTAGRPITYWSTAMRPLRLPPVFYEDMSRSTTWDAAGKSEFEIRATSENGAKYFLKGEGPGPALFGSAALSFPFWTSVHPANVISATSNVAEFNYDVRYRYLPGNHYYFTQADEDGISLVYHADLFDPVVENGITYPDFYKNIPLGTITTSGTPGHGPLVRYEHTTTPVSPSTVHEELRRELVNLHFDWNNEASIHSNPSAHYRSGTDGTSVSKLLYRLEFQRGVARKIIWAETFTAEGSDEPSDYKFKSEAVLDNAWHTSTFLIDPFERFGTSPGVYQILTLSAALSVDANADGRIVSPGGPITPYVIANGDQHFTSAGFSIAVSRQDNDADSIIDSTDTKVNGTIDLINFQPVFLDIRQLLSALPPAAGFTYKLKQADGTLNFVYTNLTPRSALAFRTEVSATGFGPLLNLPAANAPTHLITATGVDLFGPGGSAAFQDRILQHGGGIILVEARAASNAPLYLTVEKNGQMAAELALPIVVIDAQMAVDANRDGVIKLINEDSSDATSEQVPYRFWVNDDIDYGDTGGNDIPGQPLVVMEGETNFGFSADYATGLLTNPGQGSVHGRRDLIDYFPVHLDIKKLIDLIPPSGGVEYKLKQEDEAVNFIYTKLTKATARNYQTQDMESTFGPNFDRPVYSAPKSMITAQGITLSLRFINQLYDHDQSVILIEGRKSSTKPLILSVEKLGVVLAQIKLEISISSVEAMFQHINLASAAGEIRETSDRETAPNRGPSNDKNFVLLHGYNVNQSHARGWGAETFKRMWWSGSQAKFHLVTWRGSDTQILGAVTRNYHINVEHAFETAAPFAAFINCLSGETTTAAHSLGNMVVFASLNLTPNPAVIARHLAFDAAVASEAIDGHLAFLPGMAHSDWDSSTTEWQDAEKIPEVLWASEWHKLFEMDDARSKLTWRNKFAGNNNAAIYNFYSEGAPDSHLNGEEVLNYAITKPTATFIPALLAVAGVTAATGELAWWSQELFKGRHVIEGFGGSDYGGWGFGPAYWQNIYVEDPLNPANTRTEFRPPNRTEIANLNISSEQQRLQPLFLAGTTKKITSGASQESVSNLYGLAGSDFADRHIIKLLAEMMPARTAALGRKSVTELDAPHEQRNFDLTSTQFRASLRDWPQERLTDDKKNTRWLHSDAREISYRYNYKLFEKWVEISALNLP